MDKIECYDSIHGSISIDDDFCLEVISCLKEEWDRLEKIRSLGLINKVIISASHSKKEHHMGVYHLATKVPGLTGEQRKMLCLNCLIRGIGHCPYTYATEEALLLACRLSRELRNELISLLEPVLIMCKSRYTNCDKDCLQDMLGKHEHKKLYTWLTAYKIINKDLGSKMHIDVANFVNDLVCPNNLLNRLAGTLCRIDYIQRDMRYAAIGELQLPTQMVLEKVVEHGKMAEVDEWVPEPEIKFVTDVRNYLDDALYSDKRVVPLDGLFRKQMAQILARGRIRIKDLLRWGDDELEGTVSKLTARYSTIKALSTLRDTRWPLVIKFIMASEDSWGQEITIHPLDAEKKFTGERLARLPKYPTEDGFLVYINKRPDMRTEISLYARPEGISLTKLVMTVHRFLDYMYYESPLSVEVPADYDLGTELFMYVLGCKEINFNTDNVKLAFNRWSRKLTKQGVRDLVHLCTKFGMPQNSEPIDLIKDLYVGKGAPKFFPEWLCQRLIDDPFLTPLLKSMSFTILRELGCSPEKDIETFELPKDNCLEVAAYLKEVWEGSETTRSWVRPGPVILFPDAPHPLECDVIALRLKGGEACLRLVECTKQKSPQKARKDYEKLESKVAGAIRGKFQDLRFEPRQYSEAPINQIFRSTSSLYEVQL